VNPFDTCMLRHFNEFAQKSELVDRALSLFSNDWLVKGGLITGLLWACWFRKRDTARDREFIVSGVVLSIVTLVVARALALTLPFRERPRYNPLLHFSLPAGAYNAHLIHWSSFPSDNAALYFSLATCLYFVSHKIGVFAYLHALFVVSLPRIFLGFHYPTDIVGGALVGIGIASLSRIDGVRSCIARLPLRWEEKHPGLFYFFFYVFSFLLAAEFDPIRSAVIEIMNMIHHAPPAPC
jgi:undecaprenyl-diphosphatase